MDLKSSGVLAAVGVWQMRAHTSVLYAIVLDFLFLLHF